MTAKHVTVEGLRAKFIEWGLDSTENQSYHGWRCQHPDRYGPCDCFDELMADIAALPDDCPAEARLGHGDALRRMQEALPEPKGFRLTWDRVLDVYRVKATPGGKSYTGHTIAEAADKCRESFRG